MTDRNRDEAADQDITREFWGSSPTWRTTGRVPATPRNRGERTGPIARTRTHRTLEPAPPPLRDPAPGPREEEPADIIRTVFEVAHFDLDDDREFDRLDALAARPPRPARRSGAPRTGRHAALRGDGAVDDRDDEERIEVELEPRGPAASLADRLGLGAVDPLLLRLGAILMLGVLLVPFALALRSSGSGEAAEVRVVGESAPAAATEAAGVPDIVEPAAGPAGSTVIPATSDPSSSESPATSTAAAATDTPATTAPPSTAASEARLDTADVVESSPATTATPSTSATAAAATPVAEADVPAERLCVATYEVSEGDYWLRLADEAGIELSDLLAANAATVDTPLYPGTEVCLPAGAAMPSPPTTAAPTTQAPSPTAAPTTAPPATQAPTTTAAPATTAPSAPATPEQVKAIIRDVWPDDLEDKALDVAYRESKYQATAYNGWCCYGVFQVHWTAHKSWLVGIGITSPEQLFDAKTNTAVAYEIYRRAGGWGPWGG